MKNFNLIEMAKAMKEHKLRHMWRYAAMMALLLTLACGNVWGADITVTPYAPTNITSIPYGLFTLSHSSTKSSSKVSSGAITTGSNGDVITIHFATTKSDMYIKSITFNSLSNGTLSSSDGTISSNTFTASSSKNAVDIVLTSGASAKGTVKITNVVIDPGTNDIETITFTSASAGTVSFTSSAVTSALTSLTSDGTHSVSSNILSWPNSKTLVFTSSRKLTYIALQRNDGKNDSFTSSPTGMSDFAWSGNSNTVTFTNSAGGGRPFAKAYIIAAPACTSITPTFSTDYTSTTLILGEGNSSTPAINKDGSSGAITWESSDEDVATVDEDGVVTPVAAGSATITATVAANGGYCEGSVSKNFTITRDPVGEDHVLTWPLTTVSGSSESNVDGGTTDIGTGTAKSTSSYITNQTDLTGVGVKRTTTGKNSNTGKIETPTSYDAAKYVSFTFDVEDGYQFTPTEVSIKTVAVATAKDLKFEFSDANGSYSVTKTDLSTSSTAATNTLDFSECNVDFTGTVTVKIYVYGANDTYRLSTPLTITGDVAAAAAGSTYKLKGDWDSWTEHTMTVSAGVASYSIDLPADTRYEFCFMENSTIYKNNGTVLAPISNWYFSTSANNAHIHTGPAGTYTFSMNTSNHKVSVTYPDVTHPSDHYVYFKNTSVWETVYAYLANSGNDNKAAAWPGCPTPTTTICGETYHYAAMNDMSGTYNLIIFNNGGSGSGNQSWNLPTTGSAGNYNANANANWYDPSYDITFDANGGSGTMDKVIAICSGDNKTLPANTFTREGWEFDGWNTNKYGTGTSYDDEGTVSGVSSNITLYAKWKKTVYFKVGAGWDDSSAWYAIYYFDSNADSNNGWVGLTTAASSCETDVFKGTLPGNGYDRLIVCRMDGSKAALDWGSKWNQTGNIEYSNLTSNNQFTPTNLDNDNCTGTWGTYSVPTYTVSAAVSTAGYGTVSAASVAGVACGTSISASTNTLTVGATNVTAETTTSTAQYTYAFTNWTWSPAGTTVTSDITATANFTRTLNSYTVTWKNGSTTLETDASVDYGETPTYDGSTPTKDADALYTYTFSGWSPAIGTVTGDATYSAQFTATPKTVAYGDATIYAYNDSKRVVSGTRKTAMETALAGSDGETDISGSLPLLHSVAGLTSVVLAGQCKSEVKASFPWLGSYIKMKTASTTATITFNVASGYVGTATIYFSGYNKTATLTNGANSDAKTSDSKNPETEGSFTSKNIALVSGANTLTISGNNGYISRIDVALESSCTTPTIAWSTSPTNGNVGGNMTISVTSNYPAGVTITSNNSNATLSGRTVDGSTVSYTLNYAVAGNANITASVDGDGSTVCDETVNLDAVAITISKNTPTKYSFSVDKTVLCGEETATLTLEDSEDGVTYELREDSSTPIAETQKTGTGSALTWTGLGAGTYVVYAVADATYTERQMNSSKITVTTGTATSITTQPTNREVTVGEEATLTVVAAGTSLSYQWKESATESGEYSNVASGGTSASYSVTPAAAGTKWYKCVVTGTCGTETTAARKIVANAAVTYTVTYVYNGATGGDDTPSATGASVTLPEPTKTGYELEGWYTTAGAKVDDGGETYSPTANITLYARWTETCSGGGGSGSTTVFKFTVNDSGDDLNVVRNGGTLSLTTSNAFSALTGGTVTAVNINTNSGGPDKMVGKDNSERHIRFTSTSSYLTIAMSNDLAEGDTIKFTGNGSAQIQITTTTTPSATISTSTNKYIIPKNGTLIGVSTIYVWPASTSTKIKTFSITRAGSSACNKVLYHGNGAESGYIYDPNVYDDGEDPEVLGNTTGTNGVAFVKDGYVFQGWATSAEGSVAYSAGGEIENIDDDVNLYAVWEEEGSGYTVSITADPDGYGTVSSSSVTSVASGTTLSTSTNTLSVGATDVTASATSATAEYTYAFSNWTKSDGTALPSTVTADLSVYANFTRSANSYTLTWNTNGGSDLDCDGCTSGSTAYGASITAPTDPTLSNYTFDGWKTNNDGTGTTAGATMPAANTTYYAAWKQTVTLKTGAQGSGADQTPYVYINGTGVSSFTAHTASGYSLQGYYTAGSGGVKVLNANGTFAAANVTDYITSSKWSRTGAAPTLFAQWVASEDCSTSDFVIRKGDGTEYQGCMESSSYNGTATSFTAGSATTVGNAKMTISSYDKGAITRPGSGNTFSIVIEPVSGYYLKSICWAGKVESGETVSYYWDDNSGSATTISAQTTSGTGVTYNAPSSTTKFTASYVDDGVDGGGIWWRNVQVEVCAAGGTTYNVTYDGNDKTSGDVPTDATNYNYGDAVTVLGNTGSLEKTNYTFAGWTTNDDGTGSSYVADNTFSITANTTLYAKWTQTVTFDANTANHGSTGGSATAVWNATGLTGITHATPASGYKLLGYYTAPTSGTKVLNSDGSFADDNITDWIDDGKWVQNDDDEPLLYAQYEASGSIKWNLQVNSADAPIVTSSKNSSYTQISTSNMTNLDSIGLNITASKKSELTSLISTPDTKGDDCMYVTFKVATGYKFTPSLIKAIIQPVGNGEHKAVEFSLADESSHTLASASATKCDGTEKGKKTTVTLAGDGTYFTGTVTLKIFVYKHADGTNSTAQYRLGTPIQIDGEIESTCTMPSYGSVSYSQTEYVQPASASAISVVGASGDPSYQWKYNSTGDRTSGTNCGTEASVTPSTESTGTLYYWCELTNACGTVKTPAVAITVSESKSDAPSIAWTDPASTPNYGGGGYTLRATVNDDSWDGSASDLTITAPAGIRIYNTTTGTDGSSMKYIEVKFDVQTAFDRETYSSNIPFTVSADATTSYNAISADHNVSYSACSGGGGSATEELMPVDDSHMDNSTWKGGWVYDGIGMMRYGHGSSDVAPGTKNANLVELTYKMADDDVDTYYKSSANHFGFYTEKAITGIRLYVHTTNDEVTVSGVYVANSAYSTGTPSTGSVGFEAEYNDENDALRTGTHSGSAWVDITFDKEVAAEKYGQINLSNNVNIAGMAFISASGSGATLTTTLAFATTGTIAKTQSAANFTNAASVTAYSETLGAITYSSSNTDCATVDSKTGEVTITASGASDQSTTITATLAASGCYKGATTTYTITVEGVTCTVNHGTLASDVTTKCSTADATLTLTGFDSGATVQWYKGESTIGNGATYAITTEGTTSTMVTKEVGTYSVMVTKDECSGRSNSITISNYSAEVAATKIVDKWYIKNGRVTPDIALWTLNEGTHLDSVTWSTTNATGLTIADFYESDGVVYLSGKEPNTNESSDAEYTLTLRVKDECENKTLLNTSAKQITLIHQKNTDKHVLAFVVTGTEKGGFTEGITSAQTTGVDLYNEIAKNFDVQATNIYSTDDEQKLKEYYSQFDILCITDYPNTGKTGTNKKSYVDAIGSLIDIRPILTMEAWVSGLTNWKSKGISGTPKSPTTRQYSMLLQCKDHEIFSGTNPTTVGSGDETMYRIDMVDKTQEEYVTLDATYGAGAHAEKSGYEYGSKPALQGFTYDASMSSLLPIGRIDDGAGNDLEVGVERQAVMEARLLVLGINGYAMERLDDDGQTIVINALKYLMKKNAEDISDCSNYFVGGAEGDPYSWKNLDNWSGSSLPDRTQEVRIVAPCVISDTIARASSVKIVTGGTYSHGTKTANGSLTINPTGSLIVEGKIYAATAPNFFEQRTTEPENLIVKADADHTGTLIFDNEDGDTQATIEMYSPSHWEVVAGKYVKYWSYVGMPIKDVHIPDYFYGAFTYYFNEAKGWEKRFDNDIMQPFEGIGLSMQEGHKETFYGTMVSTENTDITITNHTGYGDGDNLIGNSWTAPIQIANFDAEDFGSCWATVYIFNTGKGGNTYVNANADNDGAAKAGQWLGVPIGVAGLPEYTGLKVIPAMNAFLVHDTESSSTTLHLDYDKLVRDDATTNSQINEKMRAPSRHPRKKKDVDGLMRIRVVGEKTNTDVWMLQDARFSEGFDNGWEARYNPCDDRSAQLYARSKVGVMSFIALPDLDGTVLGFAPSRDGNDYTFTFQYRGEDEYYLNDLKLQQSVLIDADNNYAFTYEKGDTNRFYVSRTPLAPQTPTGVDNASGATQSTKAIKVIYNGKLYIIRSGRVYSAEGILVK